MDGAEGADRARRDRALKARLYRLDKKKQEGTLKRQITELTKDRRAIQQKFQRTLKQKEDVYRRLHESKRQMAIQNHLFRKFRDSTRSMLSLMTSKGVDVTWVETTYPDLLSDNYHQNQIEREDKDDTDSSSDVEVTQ